MPVAPDVNGENLNLLGIFSQFDVCSQQTGAGQNRGILGGKGGLGVRILEPDSSGPPARIR